jgi:hypothetical protein
MGRRRTGSAHRHVHRSRRLDRALEQAQKQTASGRGLKTTHADVLAASLADAWQVACEIIQRAGGDPGFPGLYGPLTAPTPSKPHRLAVSGNRRLGGGNASGQTGIRRSIGRLETGPAVGMRPARFTAMSSSGSPHSFGLGPQERVGLREPCHKAQGTRKSCLGSLTCPQPLAQLRVQTVKFSLGT